MNWVEVKEYWFLSDGGTTILVLSQENGELCNIQLTNNWFEYGSIAKVTCECGDKKEVYVTGEAGAIKLAGKLREFAAERRILKYKYNKPRRDNRKWWRKLLGIKKERGDSEEFVTGEVDITEDINALAKKMESQYKSTIEKA